MIVIGLLSTTLVLVFTGQATAAQRNVEERVGETQRVVSSNPPGFKIRLSQEALSYGASFAVDAVVTRVNTSSLPDQSGRAEVPIPIIGHVNYTISNTTVTNFVKPSSKVDVLKGSGLKWTLSKARVSIRGNWNFKFGIMGLIPVKDSGWFEGHATEVSTTASATLGATSSGSLTIKSTGNCTSSISGIALTLHGGASWLHIYDLFLADAEKTMKTQLENLICNEARKTIDEQAAAVLATLKTQEQFGKELILDYGLISNPTFSTGYFETFHRGEFFFVGNKSEAPFQPSPLPNPPSTSRMVTFSISDYLLDTAAYLMQQHGYFHRFISKRDLPSANATLFDLTCCKNCTCIGNLLPAAAKLYPNATVDVVLDCSVRPTWFIGKSGIVVNFVGTSVMLARLTNGTAVYILKLVVKSSSVVIPSFDGANLKFTFKPMTANVSVYHSAIGPVQASVLNPVYSFILNQYLLPQLNKEGAQGIPLPLIDNVQLANAGLQLGQNTICVSADIKYIGEKDQDNSADIPMPSLIFKVFGDRDNDVLWDDKL